MGEALQRLDVRGTFGICPGLDMERDILSALGNPERSYPCIHVAGTNGKGSVCAMLASVLRAVGLRTGLYVSPHLVRFNERIQVDGREASDAELEAVALAVEEAERGVAARLGKPATYFEFSTAMMFEHFRRTKVDIAVLETGMGGRWDATNVVTPVVSVITPVGLDHVAYLGPDVASIAAEEAGIIKSGRPVVSSRQHPDAADVIRRTVTAHGARLVRTEDAVAVRRKSEDWDGQRVTVEHADGWSASVCLPLIGDHQLENLATVVAVTGVLGELGMTIPGKALVSGVEGTVWPGRMQVLHRDPPVLLDGGHNPPAGEAVAAFLRRRLKGTPLALVVGMCRDKDAAGYLAHFRGLVRRCWTAPIQTDRSLSAAELAVAARTICSEVAESSSVAEGMRQALEWARQVGGAVCVAGSLYLVGEVLALRGRGGVS